jgi:DNA-binding XRE family transcriptional regulator
MADRRSRHDPAAAQAARAALYEGLREGRLDLAAAVRQMRRVSGLTQAEFARHRGISLAALRQIEGGRGNPTVETLNKIASVFSLEAGFVPKQAARAR